MFVVFIGALQGGRSREVEFSRISLGDALAGAIVASFAGNVKAIPLGGDMASWWYLVSDYFTVDRQMCRKTLHFNRFTFMSTC
jgi:hypothetical protein